MRGEYCLQVIFWWWWPSSADSGFSFRPRALIRSNERTEMQILLHDSPEEMRAKWGERASLMLLQLYGGASVILINTKGEALAMDTICTVGWSAQHDRNFVKECGIDTSKHTYPFKCTVAPLLELIDKNWEENQPIVAASAPSLQYAQFLTFFRVRMLRQLV